MLEIPTEFIETYLPNPNLSICSFLTFKLPLTTGITIQDLYITHQPSNATATDIKALLFLPAPSRAMVDDLIKTLQSQNPAQGGSLACQQVKQGEIVTYPLWIITYWNARSLVLEHQQAWVLADQHLQKLRQGSIAVKRAVDDVYEALSQIPWFGSVQGFSEHEDIIQTRNRQATRTPWMRDFTLNTQAQKHIGPIRKRCACLWITY